MTVTAETPSMRLSTIRDCPRRAVYEATGAPARDLYDRERRILYSGHVIGRTWLDMWEADHPGEQLIREKKVPHPFGVGHEDGFIVSTGTVLEILSSAHASAQMVRSKLQQLVLYMEHDDDAQNGVLLIVDPRDYTDERIIVTPGTPQYDELAAGAIERMRQVAAWTATGALPARVCRKPGDARSHFCLHGEWCFDDWQPDPLPEITDPRVIATCGALHAAKARERALKSELKQIEDDRRGLEVDLADVIDQPSAQAGPYQVKRSDRTRDSFKLTLAKQDSRFDPAVLAEFTSRSEYTVWTIERAGDGDIDYGEVPF